MPKAKDCLPFASFGQDVKTARMAMGMTRKALAEKVNIDPRYLANIENVGDIPSIPVLYDLLHICKLSVDKYFNLNKRDNTSEDYDRIIQKLMLCPKQYLPIIEGAIDGAIKSQETEDA